MNKVVPIAVIVLLATLGVSAYAYAVYLPSISGIGGPGTGTLNIYLTDSPHTNSTLRYLLVNVSSVTLKYSELANSTSSTTSANSTTTTSTTTNSTSENENENETGAHFSFNVPANVGTNVNITSLAGNQLLLGSPKVPAGNVVGIVFNISGAQAFWTGGNSTQLTVVAEGKFMVPVHFTVNSNGTTNLTVDIVPNDIHISGGHMAVLSPVIHVTVVSSDDHGMTETTETTETESNSTST